MFTLCLRFTVQKFHKEVHCGLHVIKDKHQIAAGVAPS
jgi:hypothetical protein